MPITANWSAWSRIWPNGTAHRRLTDRTLEFGRFANNTAYMIPYGFYIRALFYNKRLFAEAGLDGPPETMADFMAASQAHRRTRRRQDRLLPARRCRAPPMAG